MTPLNYQSLTDDEVFAPYERVASVSQLPIVVYDNPATTGVEFSDELSASVAQLDAVVSNVTLGVSGDAKGAADLLAGCEVWYRSVAGVLPLRGHDRADVIAALEAIRA